MGKLSLGLGLGVGYVLGTRAGRERYQQIVQATQGFLGRPEVQQTLERAREAAPAPLQGSIDKLTQAASGGQGGSGGSGGSGTLATGPVSTGTVSTGTVDDVIDAEVVDAGPVDVDPALPGDVGVVVPPPPPVVGGAGDPGLTGAAVPDPLVPPTRSDQ